MYGNKFYYNKFANWLWWRKDRHRADWNIFYDMSPYAQAYNSYLLSFSATREGEEDMDKETSEYANEEYKK